MRTQNSLRLMFQTVILLLYSSNFIYAGELPSEPILRIDPSEHTAIIGSIATDDTGRWLITASADKTARVWDMRNGRLITTLRVPIGSGNEGKLYAAALSSDGKTVALGGETGTPNDGASIYLFDRASGHLLRRLNGLPNVIRHLAFSPDGRCLATTLGGNNGLRLFSVADGHLIAEDSDYMASSYSVHFNVSTNSAINSNARLVTTSIDGLLRLYRFDGTNLTLIAKRAAPGGQQPYAARFSPDGKRIAVGFADTPAVNVLDGDNLSFSYTPDMAGVNADISAVAWSRDGETLYATGSAQRDNRFYIRRWAKRGTGAVQDWAVAKNSLMDIVSLPDGRLAFGGSAPEWGVVNAEGARQLFHAPVVADFRDYQSGFTLSANGEQVRFSYAAFGKSTAIFDSMSRSFLTMDTLGLFPPQINSPSILVTDWNNTTAPKLNGTALKLDPNETSLSLALLPSGDGFILGTVWRLRAFALNGTQRWEQPVPGVVWAVNVSQDGRWVVAAYSDGTIRWHRAADGVEQLALFPHANKKHWVMWTPSGYYDASPGAEELIGWHMNHQLDDNHLVIDGVSKDSPAMRAGFRAGDIVKEIDGVPVSDVDGFIDTMNKTPPNGKLQIKLLRSAKLMRLDVIPSRGNDANKPRIGVQLINTHTILEPDFFPASRFRERFNRPDMLAKLLITQNEDSALRLANQESGRRTQAITSIAQALPPVVGITSPTSDTTVKSGKINIRYTVRTAADAPITAMRVRVNGLLQSDTRALKYVARKDDVQEIEVSMPEQDAEIQLFAENKNSTSTPAILRLKWAGKATAKVSKPKLYVLAVGVSKYKNPDYNLGLAAKDASDFASVLQKQKGKLYREVEVKLLTDDKATRDDVLEGLDWLKQQVTPNDVGMMFVAGHGMNDKLGGYYFMPHNADPDKLARTAVSQNDIKQTFAHLPGHTVFFIDTCYSGGVMGNVRTSGFVNDLASAENGAVVFTASSAGQLSQENASWGNGAFTKSVVEGLNGSADFRKSGFITAKGLDYYVDDRVKALTNGRQTPVSIAPGGVSDFPLTAVGR